MAVTVLSIDAIVSDPAIRGGRPIIAGTGVRVMDIIASHLYRKFSPEELAVQYNLALGKCTRCWPTTTCTRVRLMPTSARASCAPNN
jgi:uncharacterized protein (DUF433 family)